MIILQIFIIVATCFEILLFSQVNLAWAKNVDKYVDIVRSGNYNISFEVTSNIISENHSNKTEFSGIWKKYEEYEEFCVLSYNPQIKEAYHLFALKEDGEKVFYKYEWEKEKIDFNKIKYRQNSTSNVWSNRSFYEDTCRTEKISYGSRVLAMLGGITDELNLLPKYKVDYIGSGNEKQKEIIYEYDEYIIIIPYKARLRMYYINGRLVKCIKIYNDISERNWLFNNISQLYDGYEILDIIAFEENVTKVTNGED